MIMWENYNGILRFTPKTVLEKLLLLCLTIYQTITARENLRNPQKLSVHHSWTLRNKSFSDDSAIPIFWLSYFSESEAPCQLDLCCLKRPLSYRKLIILDCKRLAFDPFECVEWKVYVAQGLKLPLFSGACVKHTMGKFYSGRFRYKWLRVSFFHYISWQKLAWQR